MNGKVKGYIDGAVSSITYGMIPLFTIPLMREGMRTESILFYRFFIATAIIGFVMIYRKERMIPSLKELPAIALLGLLYTGSSIFLIWSYKYLAGGVATTIMFMYPVFVAIMMRVVYKEKLSAMTLFAIAIAIMGVYLLYKGDGTDTLNLTGVVFALLSGICYGSYMIVVNKNKSAASFSGLRLTFYACLVTALAGAVIDASAYGGIQLIGSWGAFANTMLLAVLSTVFSCLTLASAVRSIGSTITSVLGAFEPLSAVVCGILFLGEPFTSSLAVGIFMIIASVMIIIMEKAKGKIIASLRGTARPRKDE